MENFRYYIPTPNGGYFIIRRATVQRAIHSAERLDMLEKFVNLKLPEGGKNGTKGTTRSI